MAYKKYSNLFKYHADGAEKAKNILRRFSDEEFKNIQDKYPNILKNHSDIKQVNILNCIAIDKNQKCWEDYVNFISKEMLILEKKCTIWKNEAEISDRETKPSILKTITRPITHRDIHDFYYPNRQPIKNCILSNLNFNLENYIPAKDYPFGGDLSWAKIYNSDFSNSSFLNIQFCLSQLENVSLSGCIFSLLPYKIIDGKPSYSNKNHYLRSDFQGAILTGCDLSNSILFYTYARGAVFQNCNFSYSVLYDSNFFDTDLPGCNFTGANLINVDMRANLVGANLSGAIMLGATLLKIDGTIIDDQTIFPDGTRIHKEKNNLALLSKGISTDQSDYIWWQCPNNHEWQETLCHFSINPKCPYCQPKPHVSLNMKFYIKSPSPVFSRFSSLLPLIKSIKWEILSDTYKS